jgi:hypothetical protein
MSSVSQRFIEGLKEYNLTLEEIRTTGWKYAGGDENAGVGPLNYFRQIFGGDPESVYGPMEDECICGHPIQRHYFITDANNEGMLVIGSECIKRFLPENVQGRTCSMCMAPHRRTKNNICFDCEKQIKDEKKKLCVDCGGKKQPKFKRCYECFNHLRRQRYHDYLTGGGYDW